MRRQQWEEEQRQLKAQKEEVEITGEDLHEPIYIPQIMENTSKFSTVNLQAELAKSMQQIIEASSRESVNNTMDTIKKMVEDIPYLELPEQESYELEHELCEPEDEPYEPEQESYESEYELQSIENEDAQRDETDMEFWGIPNTEEGCAQTDWKKEPEEAAHGLMQESDGQLALCIEGTEREPQVQGQISLEEILLEQEKEIHRREQEELNREKERRSLEEAKARALRETEDIMERLTGVLPKLDDILGAAKAVRTEAPGIGALPTEGLISEEPENEGLLTEELAVEEQERQVLAAEELRIEEAKTGVLPSEELTAEELKTGALSSEELAAEELKTGALPTEELAAEESESEGLAAKELENQEPEASVSEIRQEEMLGAEAPWKEAVKEEVLKETVKEEPAEVDGVPMEEKMLKELLAEEAERGLASYRASSSVHPTGRIDIDKIQRAFEQNLVSRDTREMVFDRERLYGRWDKNGSEDMLQKEELEEFPEIDMEESFPSEPITSLSEEQKEIFSYFVPVTGMEQQLCQVLEGVMYRRGAKKNSATGNILIIGGRGSGKTVLATDIIKVIQKSGKYSSGKVGKIAASSMNQKDLSQLMRKVAGGYLIIEKAGDLSQETVTRMSLLMEQNTDGLLVILEDTRAGIEKVMNRDINFSRKFTERIKIPVFTSDELVEFARSYAREQECEIDDMGILALYNCISNIQRLDEATTLTEVKEIVDDAIMHAQSGGLKKLFGGKKYSPKGYLYLREKDFIN